MISFIGGFLTLSPEYCFIVEDACGLICGYLMAVPDAKSYFQKLEMSWIPELLNRYPMATDSDDNPILTSQKYLNEFIRELHTDCRTMLRDPEHVFKNYPSLLNLSIMSTIQDLSVPNRMLACCLAALRANGKTLHNFRNLPSKLILSIFRLEGCVRPRTAKRPEDAGILSQVELSIHQDGQRRRRRVLGR